MLNAVIDISHHNSIQDFAKVKQSGICGVIHKATQGHHYTDPTFASNTLSAQKAGLHVGAYHFGNGDDAGTQADHFLAVAGNNTLLALDFEAYADNQMSLAQAETFIDKIHKATGRYPGLYTGSAFIQSTLANAGISQANQTILSQCWLWLAEYADTPVLPKIWPAWTLWQYTDGNHGPQPHTVDGIGPCDREQFNGSQAQLEAFWTIQSTPPK